VTGSEHPIELVSAWMSYYLQWHNVHACLFETRDGCRIHQPGLVATLLSLLVEGSAACTTSDIEAAIGIWSAGMSPQGALCCCGLPGPKSFCAVLRSIVSFGKVP
jgi:hypothetical protein